MLLETNIVIKNTDLNKKTKITCKYIIEKKIKLKTKIK